MKVPRDQKIIEEIRENILDAALKIIVEEGFNSFTMRRLGGAIKMTAPNIYNYFANKDEIYINIVIRGFKMLYSLVSETFEKKSDPYERIKAIASEYLRFGIEQPQYYEIMFVSSTPKYHDYIGTSFESISEIEYRISMDIVELVMKAAYDYYETLGHNGPISRDKAERRMVRLWSTLHGMVCLNNSSIIDYVLDDHRNKYPVVLEETLDSVFREV